MMITSDTKLEASGGKLEPSNSEGDKKIFDAFHALKFTLKIESPEDLLNFM